MRAEAPNHPRDPHASGRGATPLKSSSLSGSTLQEAAFSNAFSVDVEDYYQVLNFQRRIRREDWANFERRVDTNTRVILDLLDERGVKGTFFCLGCVASEHPALIKEIAKRGHELGSHGDSHAPLHALSPTSFLDEARRSRSLLQDLSGQDVLGFRAPSFSITARTLWGLDALVDAGYAYDSSIFPVRHPDYGMPDSDPSIHRLRAPSGREIVEFPMTVARFLGRNVPVSGGGYFRLLPLSITRWGLRKANRSGRPAVFYVHPWEVDPAQPDLRGHTSRLGAFRHYTGLHRTVGRLQALLSEFQFTTCRSVLERAGFLPSP